MLHQICFVQKSYSTANLYLICLAPCLQFWGIVLRRMAAAVVTLEVLIGDTRFHSLPVGNVRGLKTEIIG